MVNAAPGDWSRDFAIDTSQHHAGDSSLLVKNRSATGTPGARIGCWPCRGRRRLLGAFLDRERHDHRRHDHNAFAGGSIGAGPNDLMIEFAEDVGISFNTSDSDSFRRATVAAPAAAPRPYTLPAMTWECIEISFDGTGTEQQLYVNNVAAHRRHRATRRNTRRSPTSSSASTRITGPRARSGTTTWRSRRRASAAARRSRRATSSDGRVDAAAAALVYLAMRRPMRGTAASTCFFPVGRSFS